MSGSVDRILACGQRSLCKEGQMSKRKRSDGVAFVDDIGSNVYVYPAPIVSTAKRSLPSIEGNDGSNSVRFSGQRSRDAMTVCLVGHQEKTQTRAPRD